MATQKIYATRKTSNYACYMAKDFSYRLNGKCIGCQFCYKYAAKFNERTYQSKWVDEEIKYNKDLYMAPIFISRYCEPFYSSAATKHSLHVASKFIENNSQVIFNTYCPTGFNSPEVVEFINANSDKTMVQIKMFNSETTEISKTIKNIFCPVIPKAEEVYSLINNLHFVDKAVVIDPLIVGVNDIDLPSLVENLNNIGIKKIIIKQLFATDYFKKFLFAYTEKSNYLKVRTGLYWTYNNNDLLKSMLPTIEICYKHNIDLQFCNNRELNIVLNNKKYNNCCMLDNPIGIYNIDKNPMHRKEIDIIKPDSIGHTLYV